MKTTILAAVFASAVAAAASLNPEHSFDKRLADKFLEDRDYDPCAGDASCGPGNCIINLSCGTIIEPIGGATACVASCYTICPCSDFPGCC